MSISDAVACYALIIEAALPIAIVFHFANLIVSTFLRSAFGGELVFKE